MSRHPLTNCAEAFRRHCRLLPSSGQGGEVAAPSSSWPPTSPYVPIQGSQAGATSKRQVQAAAAAAVARRSRPQLRRPLRPLFQPRPRHPLLARSLLAEDNTKVVHDHDPGPRRGVPQRGRPHFAYTGTAELDLEHKGRRAPAHRRAPAAWLAGPAQTIPSAAAWSASTH